jgi:choline dehydrogenase-like flavoprotein
VDAEAVSQKHYDAVIVGGGISGAILAYELGNAKKSVLILEAGQGGDITLQGYQDYLYRFYGTASKDNQSPYPVNQNAPMPRSSDAHKLAAGVTDSSGYLVQTGPFTTDTTYTRVLGGTTIHWEAKVLRMLPEDFEMKSQFQQVENWPMTYDDMEPYYEKAEFEIGVSADVEDQGYLGMTFPKDYVFPMKGLPLSYLDRMVDKGINGTQVTLDGQDYPLRVRAFPQGRNGIPNPAYKGGAGYSPIGAVDTSNTNLGGRCQGNNNCVPICPVQAKYNSNKTLAKALQTGYVELLPQSVASEVLADENGRISGITFKNYDSIDSTEYKTYTAKGTIYVLAANAIETPRLLLSSKLPVLNPLIGCNLMDHAYLLSWALMPMDCGTMRGTNCTGGIVELRGGTFRKQQAAFSVDIHNDGWGWAVGSPYSDLLSMVDDQKKFGRTLRHDLVQRVTRQLQLAFMIEVLPEPTNRITVDSAYRDKLGNMKPVMTFHVPDYTMRGAKYARQFARTVFQRLGAEDHTYYDPGDYGYLEYEGEGYIIRGGNHLAGTHIMGAKGNSVVDENQKSHDYENLYLAGGGSLPSIGTANVTLTIAALCYKTAEAMIQQLN